MTQLDFPSFNFRFKNSENKTFIFDIIRKKFVVLQPEEWVRQHLIHYLIEVKKYPKTHINVEKKLCYNGITRRYDIVVFKTDGAIDILIECKAPEVNITQSVFDQIAQYNLVLDANWLVVSNGLSHYYCLMDYQAEKYHFVRDIPEYKG